MPYTVQNPDQEMNEPGYEKLAAVLMRAYNQAARGKGKERHSHGEPFDQQVIQDMANRFGVGALLGQAFKKSEESQRLPLDRAVAELLGSIVYLAAAVIALEKRTVSPSIASVDPDVIQQVRDQLSNTIGATRGDIVGATRGDIVGATRGGIVGGMLK